MVGTFYIYFITITISIIWMWHTFYDGWPKMLMKVTFWCLAGLCKFLHWWPHAHSQLSSRSVAGSVDIGAIWISWALPAVIGYGYFQCAAFVSAIRFIQTRNTISANGGIRQLWIDLLIIIDRLYGIYRIEVKIRFNRFKYNNSQFWSLS